MKKILYSIVMAFLFWACSNETCEQLQVPLNSSKTIRSFDEVVKIANDIILDHSAESRSADSKSITVKDISVIKSSESRTSSDTLLFIVNYTDDNGFVIVSAPVSVEPVIGYSHTGNCIQDGDVAQSPFACYLDYAKEYVTSNSSIGDSIIVDPSKPWVLTRTIDPRVEVEWGQRYPEGMYCPNTIAGCVQVAMAQMMSFLKAPTRLALTYDAQDNMVSEILINWRKMNLHKQSLNVSNPSQTQLQEHMDNCEADQTTHNTLGRLCRELGYRNNASYTTEGTGSNIYAAHNTFCDLLPKFTISEVTNYESNSHTFFSLLNTHPNGVLYVRGEDLNRPVGHAWVCDGAEHIKTTYTKYKYDGSTEIVTEDKYYNHFNWGWYGLNNGYFLEDVFKPIPDRNYCIDVQYFFVNKN